MMLNVVTYHIIYINISAFYKLATTNNMSRHCTHAVTTSANAFGFVLYCEVISANST